MRSNTTFVSGPSNRSMPAATVIPVLHYPDVSAAAVWLCNNFGFSERLRIGTHRVQLNVGEGAIVIAQAPHPVQDSETNCSIMVRITNLDQHFEESRKAGAKILAEPNSYPFGERQYSVIDPGGHLWTFSETEADIDPVSWGGELLPNNDDAAG